jgi:hypothetical protein
VWTKILKLRKHNPLCKYLITYLHFFIWIEQLA